MNLTEAVKAAGVVGAGGAGFPTHVKLSAKAECFLVNAAECEPLIETDKYLCRTFPDRVVAAAVAVAGAPGREAHGDRPEGQVPRGDHGPGGGYQPGAAPRWSCSG